ncbi:hypothetical protein CICLE_v100270372mg, partial [Citrus x clementina]
MREDKE